MLSGAKIVGGQNFNIPYTKKTGAKLGFTFKAIMFVYVVVLTL